MGLTNGEVRGDCRVIGGIMVPFEHGAGGRCCTASNILGVRGEKGVISAAWRSLAVRGHVTVRVETSRPAPPLTTLSSSPMTMTRYGGLTQRGVTL